MVLDSCARARARVKAVLAGAGGGEERRAKSEDEAKRGRGRRRRWSVREWAKQSTKRRARAKSRSVGEAGMVVVPSAGARRRTSSPSSAPRAAGVRARRRARHVAPHFALLPRSLRSPSRAPPSLLSFAAEQPEAQRRLCKPRPKSRGFLEWAQLAVPPPCALVPRTSACLPRAMDEPVLRLGARESLLLHSFASYLLSRCLEGQR
jgi:hypothetical protein